MSAQSSRSGRDGLRPLAPLGVLGLAPPLPHVPRRVCLSAIHRGGPGPLRERYFRSQTAKQFFFLSIHHFSHRPDLCSTLRPYVLRPSLGRKAVLIKLLRRRSCLSFRSAPGFPTRSVRMPLCGSLRACLSAGQLLFRRFKDHASSSFSISGQASTRFPRRNRCGVDDFCSSPSLRVGASSPRTHPREEGRATRPKDPGQLPDQPRSDHGRLARPRAA